MHRCQRHAPLPEDQPLTPVVRRFLSTLVGSNFSSFVGNNFSSFSSCFPLSRLALWPVPCDAALSRAPRGEMQCVKQTSVWTGPRYN